MAKATYYQAKVTASFLTEAINKLVQNGYEIYQVLPHIHLQTTDYIIIYFRRIANVKKEANK